MRFLLTIHFVIFHKLESFRSGKVNPKFPYLLHLGIQVSLVLMDTDVYLIYRIKNLCCDIISYLNLVISVQSYDTKFLKIYPQLPPTPLQLEEDLEQLKVLENGYKMKVILDTSLYD